MATNSRAVDLLQAAMEAARAREDPLPLLAQLHDDGTHMAWMPDGYIAVYGYDVSHRVMRSPQFGRQSPIVDGSRVVWPVALSPDQAARIRAADTASMGQWLQLIDPPDHTRLKRLVTAAFTPTRIERLRSSIEAHFDSVVRAIPNGEPIEFVQRVAFPVPSAVIGELIGLPVQDRTWFAKHAAAQRFDKDPLASFEGLLAAAEGRRAIADYLDSLLDEREHSPRDDLVSELIRVRQEGDRLTRPELIALTAMMYIAAYGTTADFLTNAVLTLLRHPEQLRALRADPTLVGPTGEEVLRYCPVVVSLDYWSKADAEATGLAIPDRTPLHVFLAAANHDPTVFDDPSAFLVTRGGPPSLSFGAGAHYCLGAALARLEGEVAVSRLLREFPEWQLVGPPPEPIGYFNYRSHRSVHVAFRR